MNYKLIFTPFLALAIGIVYFSAAEGVAKKQNKDRTGSPVSSTNCTACHSGGNLNASASITVSNSIGVVNEYVPGQTYTVKVNVQSSSTNGYGFQVAALLNNNSVAGHGVAVSSNTQVTPLNGREYFEHSAVVLNSVSEMSWTAPSAGNGDVTFYGSALAVNGQGNNSGDQYTNIPNLVITESIASGIASVSKQIEVVVYPNPAHDVIRIKAEDSKSYSVQLFDMNGKLMFENVQYSNSNSIDVSSFPQGNYVVHVSTPTKEMSTKFVKGQ